MNEGSNLTNCLVSLCKNCCLVQAKSRLPCEFHDEALIEIQNRTIANNEFNDYAFEINRRLLENKIKIKYYMEEGNYMWYKPLHGLDIEKMMVKLNKKLNIFHDDDNLKRTSKRNIT